MKLLWQQGFYSIGFVEKLRRAEDIQDARNIGVES